MRHIWPALLVLGCGSVQPRLDDAALGIDAPAVLDAPLVDAPMPIQRHLYVPNDASSGIVRYALPLVAGATPDLMIPSSEALFDVAFDAAGNLVAASQNGRLFVFVPPFSATSTPFATFQNGSGTSG